MHWKKSDCIKSGSTSLFENRLRVLVEMSYRLINYFLLNTYIRISWWSSWSLYRYSRSIN